jgi:threonine/homoserine/homoserine lactone efflux protein
LTTLKFVIAGAFLGLTAGISPGPLLTLVIAESLKYSSKAGIKVALSPLLTDLPIILIAFFILSSLPDNDTVLGLISLTGGIFIAYLGYESLKTKRLFDDNTLEGQQSLKKGVIANFLNPNPYMFWLTVGTPYIIRALQASIMTLILFLFSFYMMLTGSKIIIAMVTGRSKKLINQSLYVILMSILGTILLVFSVIFFYEGYKYFKSG